MTDQPFTDPDLDKTPEQLLEERSKRIQDAMELKQPDRIPIVLNMGYMLADMYGVSHQEQNENGEKEQEMLEKAAAYFQPDSIYGLIYYPDASLAVGDRTTKFPGHSGQGPDGSFQFVEGEYMKADDYDAFLECPADWAIRKYWPRVFTNLEGLALLPPLALAAKAFYGLTHLANFKLPEVAKALRALAEAADAQAAADGRSIATVQRLAALGFAPTPLAGAVIEAPFDFMGDTLRGMRGIMTDLFRRPEKILAAQEKVINIELEYAINYSQATGIKTTFIPLHRGSDGFMSLPQFEEFYWPQLKSLMIGLIDAGLMPFVFYEGVWDDRLKYLAELPKGKTVGWFQGTDPFKAKEIIGDTICFMGGMPNSLLNAGTPEQVRDFTIRLCEEVGKGGGLIMSTAVGEMEGCKPELIKTWIDTTKEYGVYT